jgi:glycosyltransferase involved in cell wall biosynthesis
MIPEMLAIWNKLDQDNVKFLLLTSNQPGHNIDRSQLELMLPSGAITLSLEPGDVPDYLATADIGFILRQTDPLNTVASPVKFAEYLAAGLAVVTSPGLEDPSLQVQQNGLGVVVSPTPDAAEFATIIDFTERFPAQRDRIRETAITLAQNRYDWSAHLETWRQDILGEVNSPNMETK